MTIRPLRKRDLDVMSDWAPFEDPLYRLFDWPRRAPVQNGLWYAELLRDKRRVYYAVDNERHTLIGRLSLREVRPRESARLGIGFGTRYVGQGYGTEALRLFLDYYFVDLRFERLVLDVSAINERAIRCYESCGFEHTSSHYQSLGWNADVSFLAGDEYAHLRQYVKRDGPRSLSLTYDMVLEREAWLQERAS